MFDDDQVTESPELRELRDSLNGAEVPGRPPLEAIAARSRAHRRNRYSGVAGLFVAGAAAGAVLTVALAGGGTSKNDTLTPRGNQAPGEIRTGAYTLISDTSGKVKLTISPRKLFHPAALQSDLARFGIPAKVTDGRLCQSHPEPAGLSRIVTIDPRARPTTITFDPRAIPAGMELSVGRFFLRQHLQLVDTVLIRTGSFSCTTHVPTDRPAAKPGHAIGFIAIPARQATSHG
jgi:hypothetical protein